MKWLDVAWAEVGIQETSGADATPEILAFFRDAGRPDIASDETAWCAAFVGACLERAGIPQTIPPAEALLARAYLKVGQEIPSPRIGCIVVLSRGSDPRAGHVGFCVGITDTHVVLLGGNQGNKVSTQHYPRARILPGGLRWPGPVVAPNELNNSRIATAAARQKKDAGKAILPQAAPVPEVAPDVAATAPPAADIAPVPDAFPSPQDLAGHGSTLQSLVEQAASFGTFLGHRWPWIIAAVTIYYGARMAWDAGRIRFWRAEDASTGKTT
jgi:uncharacterized protein (TIGR02594 family)